MPPRKRVAPDLVTAARSGDRAATLAALRDVLAADIAACESPRDKAPLVARLTDVLDKLAALPAPAEGTVVDEVAARRRKAGRPAARRARTTG